MIGSPISIGQVSEVVPVAPRPGVWAPLVMERLLVRDDGLHQLVHGVTQLARRLPANWQRLVDVELSQVEAQLTYERFVGVTLRDLSVGLRASGRVLPIDVLRSIIEHLCEGLSAIPVDATVVLCDRSCGLSIDGQWRFAQGALNHWLAYVVPPDLAADPEFDGTSPDTMFFLSPEAFGARREVPASLVTRAALLSWQLATGGFHPYRGARHELTASFTRFVHDDVRVPLSVHPEVPPALAEVFRRGVSFATDRFVDLAAFRAALTPLWPRPAASPARTLEVVASLTWPTLQKELTLLKHEPLLPIRWDGVWSAARTPEQSIAVLEDQLLERIEPVDRLAARGHFKEVGRSAAVPVMDPAPRPLRPGLLERFLALFRR